MLKCLSHVSSITWPSLLQLFPIYRRKTWGWANRSLTTKCGLYYTLLTTDWTSQSWWSTLSFPLTLKTTEPKQPYQRTHKLANEMLKHRVAQSATRAWSPLSWLLVVWLRCLGITGGCTSRNEKKRTSNCFLVPLCLLCLWICCPSKRYD